METCFRVLCFTLVLLGMRLSYGQTYKVTWYDTTDSLMAGSIRSISQDSAGFVWVAGDNGLQRYNGRHFETVYRDTLHHLSYQSDHFTTGHRSVFRFKSQYPFERLHLETIPIKIHGMATRTVLVQDDGSIWWSDATGIHSYSAKQEKNFKLAAHSRQYRFRFARLGANLVAIENSGQLYYLSEKENTFFPLVGGNLHARVHDVMVYSDSTLAISTEDELMLLHLTPSDVRSRTVLRSGTEFTKIARDLDGNIWAATVGNKLFKFYPSDTAFHMRSVRDGTEPHRVSELRFPSIERLFVDKHNNLWVGHRQGLALVSEIPFVVVDPELPNEIIRSAAFMDEGKAYLSGIAGFFETINKGFNEYEVRPAKLGKNIYPNAICRCKDRLWLGTVNDELYFYEDGKISQPFYNSDASNIFYLFCDSQNDVWISRGQKNKPVVGILKMSEDLQLKYYDESAGFKTRMLVTREDTYGNLFVAGIGDSTYLYRYEREHDRFTNLSRPMKFDYGENFEVHDFVVSPDSTFWLATTAGLLVLKEDSIRKVDIPELYDREVVAITLSKDNVVWASTEKDGLIRYSSDSDYAVFDIDAGLQSGIMWYRSLFTDNDGKLWAGSREGITVSSHANPKARRSETPFLVSVVADGTNNPRKHVFNFESSLQLEFISLNYPSRSIEYQYKLDDAQSWTNLRQETKLQLPEMQSGSYTLYARARQSGGYYWSEPMKYSFTILSPWYYSKEAFLIYAVLMAIMIVTGTRVYNRRLIRERNRLEINVQQRTQELIKKQEEVIAQNQELQQLSEVLAANHEDLVRQKGIILKQNAMLHHSKVELEKKVEERTNELKLSNEELAQQNVQLEQFAFMTAHNLRAPVARLLGLTYLLDVNGAREPDEAELLKRIRESSRNLDETIREISEILHIKKGLHGSFSSVNLESVWSRMLPTFKHEIEGHNIRITTDFGKDPVISGVEPFVYSVFYNVVSNAIKYADVRKSSWLKLSTAKDGEYLQVVIEDNGIGFNSAQFADKLFKPFTRFNSIKEGRGLGLYLMKIQMEMMGGEIRLVSRLDEGTWIALRFKHAS